MELWFSEVQTPHVKFSVRVDRQLYSGKSEFQRIDVFESPEFGRMLVLDGYIMLTEKNAQTDRGIFPDQQGVPCAHSDLSVRTLAVWIRIKKISSAQRLK